MTCIIDLCAPDIADEFDNPKSVVIVMIRIFRHIIHPLLIRGGLKFSITII